MGYVIICALAFVLGILTVLLCRHVRTLREMDREKK